MKKLALLFGVIFVVLIIAYVILALRQDAEAPLPNPTNPFDFGSDIPTGDQRNQLPIALPGGGTLYVPDFTKSPQPAISGPETGYQVAGSNEADYQILYFPEQSYFLVSLFAEPLGNVRAAAEADLRQRLILSDAQLCGLNIEVGTDASTNETYAGQNLGLSFCPGAVPLP